MSVLQELPIRSWSVAAFVLRPEGDSWRVLLMRRTGSPPMGGWWCQIAGRIEPGEAAWQAAVREIREEAGLEVERLYSADRCEMFYDPVEECLSVSPVFVAIVEPDRPVVLNDEHSQYVWLTAAEALERLPFPAQRDILRHIDADFVRHAPSELLRIDTGSV